jgi:hypothetical protein
MAGDITVYNAEPTPARFHRSGAFVRGLMGPIGSGKSVACCMEVVRRALEQAPGKDGVRRTRWAFIRQTYPELKSTTIKTWLDWVRPEKFGPVKWEAPIKHLVKLGKDCELEVLFLALERPDDTKKLLSLELTGAWVNEAREVPKAVVDAATGRVGRFPSARDGGCTWSGVLMDTNPPDDDHWWYRLAEEERPDGWEFFKQPGGRSALAENLGNLPRGYYARICAGKDENWIRVYVDGAYGTVEVGRPVYKGAWNDTLHVAKDELWPLAKQPVVIGFDFGLTPAAVFAQVTPRGQFRVIDELVATDMGLRQFCENVVVPLVKTKYQTTPLHVVGDPAGAQRDYSEDTAFDILDEVLGEYVEDVEEADSNDPTARIEAVKWFLTRLTDGQPTFQLSPSCRVLRKGFNGGYKFRRLQVAGEERYTEKPDKNDFSHPHDALQYAALRLRGGAPKKARPLLNVVSQPADAIAGY